MRLPSLIIGVLLGVTAIPAPSAAAVRSQPGCGRVTAAAVAGYADSTMPQRLSRDRVPGAVMSVVSGGRTQFARGYGFADVARHTPMDPQRSLVRIASITKLFTWAAVMQQVEAGRLDLNADVNRYLTGFRVPATFPAPVTLGALLSHTAGFEDRVIGTGARTAGDVPPLADELAAAMPARVRPPGEITAYSNYGAALAGYVVAQVSGEPWDRYVQRHLLDPLGMAHSTATEPVPPALAGDLARSYDSDAEPPAPIPFTFDTLSPDGAISASAADMAKFMTAHLDGGRGILSPDTTALMHARSFGADPRLGGYAHGFMDRVMNGHRVLMHDGSWEGFQSALVLVPGCDLGLFVSANGTNGVDTVSAVVDGFMGRFAPPTGAADPTGAPVAGVGGTSPAVAQPGFYAPTRRAATTVERLTTLLGEFRLTVAGDGTVHFKGRTWIPQGDGVYRRDDGKDHLMFRSGPGSARYVATDGPAYELLGSAEEPLVNAAVVLAVLGLGLSAVAVPLAAGWRRLRPRGPVLAARWRVSRALAATAALLAVAFLVGLTVTLTTGTGDFLYAVPTSFRVLLTLPLVMLALAAVALAGTVTGWRGSGARVASRIHQVVLLAVPAGLTWFLWQWNLLGWQFG
ncbi:serine hydrolase domain-containing protein [Krasilnikovia sp. MM14-A1259]|uniref:serine hydrolase domain-containing protein n=1 Tax=Krasilnikovia sp. MM14-A1259 TaxID=3373539 RepID=UPI003829E686